MARHTIDFGIDLGTTNSEIACFMKGEIRIFKSISHEDHTPSAVFIDSKGKEQVGKRAYKRLEIDEDNTAAEFKRDMGLSVIKTFPKSKRSLTPEELSSLVLKELKGYVSRDFEGENVNAAVITVPAAFEIIQCEATKRAANLAGIEQVILLQEPIAASVAYGFDKDRKEGYWLVYDLGGGTFDVAVMSYRDGMISVVNHYGDNYLGGKDFDWRIVEHILLPKLNEEYNLTNVSRASKDKETRKLLQKLKFTAEEAKIGLSYKDSVSVDIDILRISDEDGNQIDTSIEIYRKEYEPLIEDKINETINLCRQALKDSNLSPKSIDVIILVGGPTITPYLRERLKKEIGVPIETKVDPITVVAKGAAIFASSQPISLPKTEIKSEDIQINLEYNPMTPDTDPMIAGKIELPPKGKLKAEEMTIRFVREDKGWESGKIPVKNAAFVTNIMLMEWKTHVFDIFLYDQLGNSLNVIPNKFTITHGVGVANPPLPHSIGIEVLNEYDGKSYFSAHLKKGTSLPCKGTIPYNTAYPLTPGNKEDVINIILREGDHKLAERNRWVDRLAITGEMVKKRVPAEVDIEITLEMDISRILKVSAYIPMIDQYFEQVREFKPEHPTLRTVLMDFKYAISRIEEIENIASNTGKEIDTESIKGKLDDINEHIEAAKGEGEGIIKQAKNEIQDLQAKLDKLEQQLDSPKLKYDYKNQLEATTHIVNNYGNELDKKRLDHLIESGRSALEREDNVMIRKVLSDLESLQWQVIFRNPDYWIGWFQRLVTEEIPYKNPEKAETLIESGSEALAKQDMETLQNVVFELWALIPSDERKKMSEAGIKKK